jgi:hypothetical protein
MGIALCRTGTGRTKSQGGLGLEIETGAMPEPKTPSGSQSLGRPHNQVLIPEVNVGFWDTVLSKAMIQHLCICQLQLLVLGQLLLTERLSQILFDIVLILAVARAPIVSFSSAINNV